MAYADNLEALASKQGVSLPLTQDNLDLMGVKFIYPDGHYEMIFPTSKNLGSRLFLQSLLTESGGRCVLGNLSSEAFSHYRDKTGPFFAEHFEDWKNGGEHPMIKGLCRANGFHAFFLEDLKESIEQGWIGRKDIKPPTNSSTLYDSVRIAVDLLDKGFMRIAEKRGGNWVTNEWLKKAVLLSFRLSPNRLMGQIDPPHGIGPWFDKVPNKFDGWGEKEFTEAGFRAVPGSIVRRGAYVAKGAILMPSFVNIGGYVDENTTVDTSATVGSCAQIGKNVHLSGGVGIGGVLEPLQANPTIIEDNCFIGARSEVVEGVVVGEGSVLSMGVFISQSTKIVDRATGKISYGKVPPYSVVVPGSLPDRTRRAGGLHLSCAVIVKTVDAQTRSKTSVNDLLRD